MRYLAYLFLMLLVSCKGGSGKIEGNHLSDITFSVDTVIIDPGDEIIFLKYHLFSSDVDKNGKYLFNFNVYDHTVEKINLDELRLEAKLPFEKEGPNGTGPSVGKMKVQNESQITINSTNHTSLFSLNGEKLMTIYYEDFSLDLYSMQGEEYLKPDRALDTDADRLYVLIYSFNDESYSLAVLNLEEFEVTRLGLESFEEVSNYDIIYSSSGLESIESPQVNLEKFGTKVILSNEITNTLMWYDSEMDSLFIKPYTSQLTANQKEKEYIKEHETVEEFQAEYRRLKQEINFMPLFWDEKNKVFYRFSYLENENNAKVYLTAYDEELNQIGETLVPQLAKRPGRHFVKDGKIWIYENMNDEMAFVRLGMSEPSGKEVQ